MTRKNEHLWRPLSCYAIGLQKHALICIVCTQRSLKITQTCSIFQKNKSDETSWEDSEWDRCKKVNVGCFVSLPEYGGLGLDFSYSVAVAEELGSINCGGIPMAIGVQTDMATPALARWGPQTPTAWNMAIVLATYIRAWHWHPANASKIRLWRVMTLVSQ